VFYGGVFNTLVQYALRFFLAKASDKESAVLQAIKKCLLEKMELHFDEKMAQHQKDLMLVSYRYFLV
jgi:hypothetical protein